MTVKLTPKRKEALNELGIMDVNDIIFYYPYRYEMLTYLDEENWQKESKIITELTVVKTPKMSRFRGNQSVVYVDCESDKNFYKVSIFNRPYIIKQLGVGTRFTVIGKYEGNNRILAMQINFIPLSEQLGIHPVYSLKDKIREKDFKNLIAKVFDDIEGTIKDYIPEKYLNLYNYCNKEHALRELHHPSSEAELIRAKNTLKYEEFLRFNLIMQSRKKNSSIVDDSYIKHINVEKVREFVKELPFTLTNGQKMAVKEILDDLASNKQMFRLLQGDVGCGKTLVAFVSMYAISTCGKQAALMAPTEILAKQHYENLKKTFGKYGVGVGILYSSQSNDERTATLKGLADGSIQLVVGTHSLFQNQVDFKDLGLIITDEQHRFGVKQRQSLLLKGNKADVLLMSATPIPRTLATSLYGDLDVSTITETPNKGKKINTVLIRQNSFVSQLDEIEDLLAQGNQMYVICPSIEKGTTGVRDVKTIYKNLSDFFKGRYTVGLLHGQMDQQQKDEVEAEFHEGKIRILVSTTVIEVGIDVKNANIMVIYDANRFGLSQLHQLRGRVGRGEKEGYCYLLTGATDEETIKKLEIIEKNSDGFKISYYDLQLRGPGDIMGYRQSGLPEFILGNVIEDTSILNQSMADAKEILSDLERYPWLEKEIEENKDDTIILS